MTANKAVVAVGVLSCGGLSPYLQQRILTEAAPLMKDDRVYLQHIRDALQDIDAYCGTHHDAFLSDRMRQDATLRKLEIIGQAVKNLSEPGQRASRRIGDTLPARSSGGEE